jgi:hypothetical protein
MTIPKAPPGRILQRFLSALRKRVGPAMVAACEVGFKMWGDLIVVIPCHRSLGTNEHPWNLIETSLFLVLRIYCVFFELPVRTE